jgi:hypothetical protein
MVDDFELITAIYDAIIDPTAWDFVVKRIVEVTKSVSDRPLFCCLLGPS